MALQNEQGGTVREGVGCVEMLEEGTGVGGRESGGITASTSMGLSRDPDGEID